MAKPNSVPEKKWIGLLGGPALFGYLGCLPPDSTLSPQPRIDGTDSVPRVVSADTNFVRPIPVSQTDSTIAIRTGPTLGEPCGQPDSDMQRFCTLEGEPVKCVSGILIRGAGFPASNAVCHPGDTLAHYNGHFGFTGLDKSGHLEDSAAIPLRARVA